MAERHILNDLAKMASGAMGTLAGARGEIEEIVRTRLERALARLDLVSRDEFEAVKQMAIKARQETDALAARLATLEAPGPQGDGPAKSPSRKAKPGA